MDEEMCINCGEWYEIKDSKAKDRELFCCRDCEIDYGEEGEEDV